MTFSVFRKTFMAAALAALGLTACHTSVEQQPFGFTADKFKPRVVQVDESYEFAPAPYDSGLNPGDRAGVAQKMAIYARTGRGTMVVSYPRNSANEKAAAASLDDMRAMAASYGVSANAIQAAPYEASGQNRAPVSIRFARLEAVIPKCGTNWASITETANNEAHPNFGCATNANLAAMVADPADLIEPGTMGPVDQARRQTVLETYRKGEATAAERSDSESGTFSDSGQ